MSQGFNHPAFPVDTHVHRLAQRWRLTKGKNVKVTEADLKKGFPRETGINSIYRLFTTEESIAQRMDVMAEFALSVLKLIKVEELLLLPPKRKKRLRTFTAFCIISN